METFIYENKSLSENTCNEIIKMFDNIHSNNSKKNVFEEIINTNILENNIWFDIKNELINEIKKHLELYYIKLDNNIFHFDTTHKNKTIYNFSIKKYVKHDKCNPKDNLYNYHHNHSTDFNNKKSSILNIIWYLNSIDNGGETECVDSYKIKPETGKIALFPSEWFFPYRDNPSVSDDKYIITGLIYIDI